MFLNIFNLTTTTTIMALTLKITSKKTISELYDILSTKLGFGIALDSISSIVLVENGIIVLDNRNDWLANFAYGEDIQEYLKNKLNKE